MTRADGCAILFLWGGLAAVIVLVLVLMVRA